MVDVNPPVVPAFNPIVVVAVIKVVVSDLRLIVELVIRTLVVDADAYVVSVNTPLVTVLPVPATKQSPNKIELLYPPPESATPITIA